MKGFFLIVFPLIIITYCLFSIISNFIGLGPLDTYPRTLKTVNCENIEAKVYRKKMLESFLIGTDNRLEIKTNGWVILDERLYWADIWKDVEFENLTLVCEGNEIKTSAKRYFDNSYKIHTDGTFKKEKKFPW